MSRPSLRDRFFTPPVAKAMTSPSGLLLAAGGAGVAVLAGAPVVAVPVVAVLAWGGRVVAAIPRSPRPPRMDPFTLGEPWRRFVQRALQARSRFDEVVTRTRPGPVRDRLEGIGERVGTGVEEVWRIAQHGQALSRARKGIDRDAVQRQLAAIEADDPHLEHTAEALRSQLATVERLDRTIAEANDKLRLLEARLDEAVARTLELSVQTSDPLALGGLGADVDDVVSEMEALRLALEETGGGTAAPGTG